MPNKTPEEATIQELETFLRSHEVPIPAAREDPRYREVLVDRTSILLRIMGRDTIRVERQSFLNRFIRKTKKNTPTRESPTENEIAFSVASEPVLARRRNVYERQRVPLVPLNDILNESDDERFTEPEYAEPPPVVTNPLTHQLRNMVISPPELRFSQDIPPPLPPRPIFPTYSSLALEPSRDSNTSSGIEVPRLPPKKRLRKRALESSLENQDMSMPHVESTKIEPRLATRTQNEPAQNLVVQTKSYTTKFTTIFNEVSEDIEQYLVALKRWQRLNNISDRVAISVGLQNFKNSELANYTETSLSEGAFLSLAVFCEEVTRMLGKTSNQWLDQFDSIKRRNSESCFTFFARLQSVLKNALGVSTLNSEHKRLIVRKFLKSVHPTLRGHLESRDEPISFDNAAMIANRIELALGLPKGSTVTEVHNIQQSSRPPQHKQTRAKHFCHICNREGSHTTAYCYGNPNSENFDLDKFKVIHGVSKN